MAKLTIYIPSMKLKVIDQYCSDRKISRSEFLTNAALGTINATKYKIKCDFCSRISIGKFKLTTYSWETGELKEEKHLCEAHLDQAKKEGAKIDE